MTKVFLFRPSSTSRQCSSARCEIFNPKTGITYSEYPTFNIIPGFEETSRRELCNIELWPKTILLHQLKLQLTN